jgi:hypothetical protein
LPTRKGRLPQLPSVIEGSDRILLSKDDPKALGRHHLISIDWVDYVDRKVHLNKPSQKVMSEWQVAA